MAGIGFEIPDEMAEMIEQIAKRDFTSKSSVIRRLLAKGLKQEGIDYERTRLERA